LLVSAEKFSILPTKGMINSCNLSHMGDEENSEMNILSATPPNIKIDAMKVRGKYFAFILLSKYNHPMVYIVYYHFAIKVKMRR